MLRNKSVRDLHWVMSAPHLLTSSAGVPILADEWCTSLCERAMRWLQSLDENPAPLHDWLRSQRNVRRLGFYFAALLEYWIRFCPFLGNPTVLAGQQVHAGIDGQCAGQLKLVFERDETELVHWESHVKFFAFCPNEDGGDEEAEGEADAEDDVVSATASEASASTTSVDATATTTSTSAAEQPAWVPPPRELCARWQRKDRLQAWDKLQAWPDDAGLATYVGPFLGENLLHRVVELRRKLSLSDAPAVRSFLSAHFPQASEPRTVKAESVIRGYLFYPLGADGDGGCGAISANHSRGWWTRSLESLLSSTEPASMWALPGNGAGVREDAVGALGGKLHWLSPAIAFESRGRLRIGGIPSLGVEDSEVLTADELREALLVQSDTAKLLLQLLPSSDADADGGGRVGGGLQKCIRRDGIPHHYAAHSLWVFAAACGRSRVKEVVLWRRRIIERRRDRLLSRRACLRCGAGRKEGTARSRKMVMMMMRRRWMLWRARRSRALETMRWRRLLWRT